MDILGAVLAYFKRRWIKEGLHYSLEHPSTLIPYLRFIKLIVSHYMTAFPEIFHRVRDRYHNLKDDDMVKSIFNSGKNKAGIGMKIPRWMKTNEMKLTKHSQMYVALFGVDVPTTQSQPIESTQGMHRPTSAPMLPNPDVDEGESSALRNSTTRFLERKKFNVLAQHLQEVMEELLLNMVDDHDDPHDDAPPKGKNSVKRQKISKHGTYAFRESSSGQVNKSELDDDELPIEKVSQELVEKMSKLVDKTRLRKVVDEMFRQRTATRDIMLMITGTRDTEFTFEIRYESLGFGKAYYEKQDVIFLGVWIFFGAQKTEHSSLKKNFQGVVEWIQRNSS
nr:hypothetical protein [Tanacetum cinerariifolium]